MQDPNSELKNPKFNDSTYFLDCGFWILELKDELKQLSVATPSIQTPNSKIQNSQLQNSVFIFAWVSYK